MGQVVDVSVRFPAVTFTPVLVVALGFRAPVRLGRIDPRGFDADAPSPPRSLGGIPIAARPRRCASLLAGLFPHRLTAAAGAPYDPGSPRSHG
ncbi:hypothetical protein ACWD5R_37375 [Streptomyces sp. NPDC002514]|uniref:hypothetical protein n=1 Tax=unclassified Streptomyces TaxID=2593676 RepID=UPI00367C86D3